MSARADSQHLKAVVHQLDGVPIAHGDGLEGNALSIGSTGHHFCVGPDFQQPRGPTDVICMVVGLQHSNQLQSLLTEPVSHRFADRWVHHHSVLAPHQNPDDVVLQHGKRMQCGSHR